MKKIICSIFLIFFAAGLVSCGSAGMGAPPVSLPTPVTGRIVISSPNADGNVNVVGEDSSVEAASLVLVINEGAVTLNWPERILDLFVNDAYAADNFPLTCSLLGRTCVFADENGAFEISIPASIGDNIIVVLIDSVTGEELSERLSREVPENLIPFVGGPRDIQIDPFGEKLFILFDGAETGSNRIEVATLSPWTLGVEPISMSGDSAIQMLFNSEGGGLLNRDEASGVGDVVISRDPPVDLDSLTFEQFLLEYPSGSSAYIYPTDITYISDASGNNAHAIIPNGASTPAVYLLNMASIELSGLGFEMDCDNVFDLGQHISTDVVSQGVANVQGSTGKQDVAAVAFLSRFKDSNENVTAYLSIYSKAEILDWTLQDHAVYPCPIPDDIVALPSGAVAEDVVFLPQTDRVIVIDSGNDQIHRYALSLIDNAILKINSESDSLTFDGMTDPKKAKAVVSNSGDLVVFILVLNGNETQQDTVLTVFPDEWASGEPTSHLHKYTQVGLLPSALAFDKVNEYLYVSCFTSKSIARLSLSEILPSQ